MTRNELFTVEERAAILSTALHRIVVVCPEARQRWAELSDVLENEGAFLEARLIMWLEDNYPSEP